MGVVRPARAFALTLLALVACANLDGLAGGSGDASPDGGRGERDAANLADTSTPSNGDATLDAPKEAEAPAEEVRLLFGALGGAGYSDGTATEARFDRPTSMARDAAGNTFVVDGNGTVIRKIAASTNAVTTLAGVYGKRASGSSEPGELFLGIRAMASNADHTLYVVDGAACMLRRVDTETGSITTLMQSCGLDPVAMRWSSSMGLLYLLEPGRLSSFQPNLPAAKTVAVCGTGTVGFKTGACASAQFGANDFVLDPGDPTRALLRDRASAQILAVDLKLKTATQLTSGGLGNGDFLATRTATKLLVNGASTIANGGHTIAEISIVSDTVTPLLSDVEPISRDGSLPNARFELISGLLAEGDGNVLAADRASIREITPSSVLTLAGRTRSFEHIDGVGASARIHPVTSMVKDDAGKVVFYEGSQGVVRTYDPTTQEVKTLAGAPSAEDNPIPKNAGPLLFDGQRLVLFPPSGSSAITTIDRASGFTKTESVNMYNVRIVATTDGKGRFFVLGDSAGAVSAFTLTEVKAQPFASVGALGKPFSIEHLCYDRALDKLFAVGQDSIKAVSMDASVTEVPNSKGLANANGVACNNGVLYFATPLSTIVRFDTATSDLQTIAGVDNRPIVVPGPLPARLNTPAAPLLIDSTHLLVGSRNESVVVSVPVD